MEKIKILNSHGENLDGIFYKSESNKLVVVCPGRMCSKEEHFYPELCEELLKKGFNAFRFDFSGNGESEGKFEDSNITKDIEDINSVVEFFKNKNYEIFCLIGHSQGAVEVLLHQAKYSSADNVVDIAGYADQKDATINKFPEKQIKELNENGFLTLNAWGKTFRLYRKYFYDRVNYGDITNEAGKIKVPVLVIHGTKDKDVPFSNSEKILQVLNENSKFFPVAGAGHFFKEEGHKRKLIGEIAIWLKNNL